MRRPRKRTCGALLATTLTTGLALLPLAAANAKPTNQLVTTPTTSTNQLVWKPCESDDRATGTGIGMECASLRVPVDWSKPDGRQITLELGRLPSTGSDPAEGSVLVAYGGPGGPGIGITQQNPKPWSKLRARMDIVTWDTRGYGEQFGGTSTGMDCTWTRVPTPNVPPDAAEFGRLARTNYGNAFPCRTQDPAFFDNMSSADHARDMEAIRKALGESKLNFYGASYATFYGQAYAKLYPERIRTMVLDGGFSHSPDPRTGGWAGELAAHAKRNERTFGRFVDWCDTEQSCVLHGKDVEQSWQRLVTKAKRSPIPGTRDGVTYHYDDADLRGFGLGLARHKDWPGLAKAIRDALHVDASSFVPAPPQGPYPDLPTGITECLDMPRIESYEKLAGTVERLERIAPNTGAVNTMATNTLQCVGWPTPVTNPPAPLPDGVPPLVGAGAWDEFDAMERVLDQVPGSGSIFHDDAGHTLYMYDACARRHIDRYFTDLVVPPRRTEC